MYIKVWKGNRPFYLSTINASCNGIKMGVTEDKRFAIEVPSAVAVHYAAAVAFVFRKVGGNTYHYTVEVEET